MLAMTPADVFKVEIDAKSFAFGLFAGDGNLDYGRVRIFCSEEEHCFFSDFVVPLFAKTFDCKPNLSKISWSTNCWMLSINSRTVEKIFRHAFNYKGKKAYNLKIPNGIDAASFIAGLIASDGSIVISKNGSTVRKYPILKFTNKNERLIRFFTDFLEKNDLSYYIYKYPNENFILTIKGSRVNKLMKMVSILNPVQKSKLDLLNRNGFIPENAKYSDRLKLLDAAVV